MKGVKKGEGIYYSKTVPEIFAELKTSDKGLENTNVIHRRQHYGHNELEDKNNFNLSKLIFSTIMNPFYLILILGLGLSLFLKEYLILGVLVIMVLINFIINIVLDYKNEKLTSIFNLFFTHKVKVVRNGQEVKIDPKMLVPGDIIILEKGDKIFADARIIEQTNFKTREVSLRGDLNLVKKNVDPLDEKITLLERNNMVYSSTIVVSGKARAVVVATGMNTELGHIISLTYQRQKKDDLTQKILEFGKRLGWLYLIIIGTIFVKEVVFLYNPLKDFLLITLTLTLALIPLTLFPLILGSLIVGKKILLKQNVVIKNLLKTEVLGGIDIICTNKVNTLTSNQITVKKIFANNNVYDVSGLGYQKEGDFKLGNILIDPRESFSRLLKIGLLCNNSKIEYLEEGVNVLGNPHEAALIVAAEKAGYKYELLTEQEKRVYEIIFTSNRKMMTTIHSLNGKDVSYTKGYPETILENCDKVLINGQLKRLTRLDKRDILQQVFQFNNEGLKVFAFAYNDNFKTKNDSEVSMTFVGLQAMMDPPREEIKQLILDSTKSGLRYIIFSNDDPNTAKVVAKELGIKGNVISAEDVNESNILKNTIFVKLSPEQKLMVVEELRKKGFQVAYVGDEINDLPALKRSNLAITNFNFESDPVQEIKDITLDNDHISSLINGISVGRKVFNNIKDTFTYLLSTNFGQLMLIFLSILFGLPLPLILIQIVWLNLVVEPIPAISLWFGNNNHKFKQELCSRRVVLTLGTIMTITSLIIFKLYLGNLARAQTMVLTLFVLFSFIKLDDLKKKLWVGTIPLVLQVILIYSPLNNYFGLIGLGFLEWGILLLATAIMFIINKGIKKIKF
jgi:P-type Ca2+ transporter type 2C